MHAFTTLVTLSLSLLAVSAPAFAEPMAIPHDAPDTIPMFEQVRYITGTARSKDGCDAAMQLAVAEMDKKAGNWKMDQIVTYVGGNDFVPVDSADCEQSGKNAVVSLDALAVKAGKGAVYPPIPVARVHEIVQSLVTIGFNVKGQLASLAVVDSGGALYLQTMPDSYGEVFALDKNTNDRAVVLFRESLAPNLRLYAQMLGQVDEIHGASFTVVASRLNKDAQKVTETWRFEVPTATILAFNSGDITEQGVIDASRVFRDGARTDVSMVAADD